MYISFKDENMPSEKIEEAVDNMYKHHIAYTGYNNSSWSFYVDIFYIAYTDYNNSSTGYNNSSWSFYVDDFLNLKNLKQKTLVKAYFLQNLDYISFILKHNPAIKSKSGANFILNYNFLRKIL